MKDLTLLIPAKNESESLPQVIEELKKFSYNFKVILHPTDTKTIESLTKYNAEIVYQKNFGYGDALIEGIKNCNTKFFCIFNADGSFNPNEISNMYMYLENNKLDIIFGSRYQKNSGSDDDNIITFIGNYIFTYLGKIFFKLKITDILYTFVIGKTDQVNLLNLKRKDFGFCVELPIKANRNNLNIGSTNSYERKRLAGKKNVNAFKDGFLILTYMYNMSSIFVFLA